MLSEAGHPSLFEDEMSSLKNPNAPCLTCKHAPHVAHIQYTDDVQAWQVQCPRCRMSGPLKPTKVEAVNAWNSMSLAVQIADAGKRCEEELDGSRKWGNFRQELRRLLEQWEVDDEDDPDA